MENGTGDFSVRGAEPVRCCPNHLDRSQCGPGLTLGEPEMDMTMMRKLLEQAWADNDRLRAENKHLTERLEKSSLGAQTYFQGTGVAQELYLINYRTPGYI